MAAINNNANDRMNPSVTAAPLVLVGVLLLGLLGPEDGELLLGLDDEGEPLFVPGTYALGDVSLPRNKVIVSLLMNKTV